MSPPNHPTILIFPGHWHTTQHATPLISALQLRGLKAQAHQLASVGLKPTRPTFTDDVNVIFSAVTSELNAGRDICLVLHSFAGMPGAEALNRLHAEGYLTPEKAGQQGEKTLRGRGRLIRAIFLTAFVFPAGYIMDAALLVGPENPDFTIDENSMNIHTNPHHAFFSDIFPPSSAQPWIDLLAPTYYLGSTPVLTSDAWSHRTPITAILMKNDNAIPVARQEAMWQAHEHVWMEGGHTPYVSQPERVAEVIVEVMCKERREGDVSVDR